MYRFLDIFFVAFHSSLVVFNLFGWIWKKTRLANLITLLLTGASWSILGWIVGTPGYCPLTDWHFAVLYRLGKTGIPSSYIKYLADRITGLNFDPQFIDNATLTFFLTSLAASVALNTRDYVYLYKRKKN